jgi:hypothetical protein
MKPRFDVFRKQCENFIKWVGTAESSQDVGKLIQADSESAETPEDRYVVIHSAYGVTEARSVTNSSGPKIYEE